MLMLYQAGGCTWINQMSPNLYYIRLYTHLTSANCIGCPYFSNMNVHCHIYLLKVTVQDDISVWYLSLNADSYQLNTPRLILFSKWSLKSWESKCFGLSTLCNCRKTLWGIMADLRVKGTNPSVDKRHSKITKTQLYLGSYKEWRHNYE